MSADVPAAEAIGLTRSYAVGKRAVPALREVSLSVARGDVVAVMGPSGSGKSTLLFLLAGLERADAGVARVGGVDWNRLEGKERASFRRRQCAFIPQGLSLLPQATAAENVEVPLLLDGVDAGTRTTKVGDALDRVGLSAHGRKLPDQLSGGEQQRVAIARALVTGAPLILADEPTGSLDSATGQDITRLLVATAADIRAAVILVTHDPNVARHAGRVVALHSGRVDADASHPRMRLAE